MKAVGCSAGEEEAINARLRSELVRTSCVVVIERERIDAVLSEQGLQLTGCTDQSCIVRVGQILNAESVVTGSVVRLGTGTYSVDIGIVDVTTGRIDRTISTQHNETSFSALLGSAVPYLADAIAGADCWLEKAKAIRGGHELDESRMRLANKAIAIDSSCAEAYAFRANIFHGHYLTSGPEDSARYRRMWEGAYWNYQKAVSVEPQNPRWRIGLSYLLPADAAIEQLNRALFYDPSCHEALARRASVYSYSKDNQAKAIEDLSAAIRVAPGEQEYRKKRAFQYRLLDQHASAVEDLNYVLSKNSADTAALLDRAQSHYELGNYDLSRGDFTRALELLRAALMTQVHDMLRWSLTQEMTDALKGRAECYLAMKDTTNALEDLHAALKKAAESELRSAQAQGREPRGPGLSTAEKVIKGLIERIEEGRTGQISR